MNKIVVCILLTFFFIYNKVIAQPTFVQRKGAGFYNNGKPYYFIGTNYWYGGLLGLEKDKARGVARLRKELDFLKSSGVVNVRVVAGAEGEGLVNGVHRIGPALQTDKGVFNEQVLDGLDHLLSELQKRDMKAVLFFSNNWEWSGGLLQYLRWNNQTPDSIFRRKMNWDELRDQTSKFYSCVPCKEDYLKQVALILNRTNKISKKKYTDDPTILAWELANEPRPMRPTSNDAYKQWIDDVTTFIKSKDKNHLVTLGHEGFMGVDGNLALFEEVHAFKNVDYLTIHIWPKNWSWFRSDSMEADFQQVVDNTISYINKHMAIAQKLGKPLVIEEFGFPRDHHSFDPKSSTTLRDRYYNTIFSIWNQSQVTNGGVAGANFWAFGGIAKPTAGQTFWKAGDDYMGDPPMEEQGLNTVFDSDKSTFELIRSFTKASAINELPVDKQATKQTINLYNNLKRLMNKGVMFGHQDALAYGVNWKYIPGRSDVKDLVGDYPAVYGWELGNLEHADSVHNLDSVPFDKMKDFIREAYDRGGVNTISWHLDNPLNGASSWDTTHGSVASILPGGSKHDVYNRWLDHLAAFMKDLKGKNGEAIPILFRPYHELTGNWFWWCKNTCTPTEYKLLWRYTVDYLRNVKDIHNLLYVYNTADFKTKAEFLERYPGDDVVDVVSFDSYQYSDPLKDSSFLKNVDLRLGIIEDVALERNKIPAFAETGYEKIPYKQWWTQTLGSAIGNHRISYVLAWRNAGLMSNGNMHYYVPTKNDTSADDFKKFYNLKNTLFQKEVARERVYQ